MQRVVLILVLAALGWYGWDKYEARTRVRGLAAAEGNWSRAAPGKMSAAESKGVSFFTCDGRTQCGQMTSCDEAKFFLKNCPGTTMDGNSDGVPCERQWCK